MAGQDALCLEGVSKSFGANVVLRDVSLQVRAGEVHALVGENGSGKSTLIKILSGYHKADTVSKAAVGGVDVRLPLSRVTASKVGLGFVHQDLGLLESASVTENLLLGRYDTKFAWRIPWAAQHRRTAEILDQFGLEDVHPTDLISSLSGAQRAMVAVARAVQALHRSATPTEGTVTTGLLVVDEVTAYLPDDAVRQVLATFRRTADLGLGVLFVTHRLEEVFGSADRVTVLRDGAVAASCELANVTRPQLVSLMIGKALDEDKPKGPGPGPSDRRTEAVVKVRELSFGEVERVDFSVRYGEVVGLTGLVGTGFEAIPYALYGATRADGYLMIGARTLALRELTPRQALDAGVALIPAGRLLRGAVGAATIAENMCLITANQLWRLSFRGPRHEAARAKQLIDRFGIRPAYPDAPIGRLSGGNQQKAIIAKWLSSQADLFIIHEPTQGVDVGAKGEILRAIRNLGEAGKAVLVASADQVDLARVCDRVIVLRDGGIHSELSGRQLSESNITAAAHGLYAGAG